MKVSTEKTYEELQNEIRDLHIQLEEANDTIDAIRTGQIDALIVEGTNGHEIYTLKSADQSYRVFIEKMIEGAVTLNKEQIITYCNSRFASMVNMPLSKVIGLPFKSFIDDSYGKRFDILCEKAFTEDCKEEIVLAGKDNTTPCQLSLTSIELTEGISLIVILTDLSNQKETEKQLKIKNEQLEHVNNALELSNIDLQQFAYVASHDLQEPLRKIQIFSLLIQERYSDKLAPKAQEYFEKIIVSSARMKSLIEDILNYSAISNTDNTYVYTDLKSVVLNLVDDFELAIKQKKAEVIVEDIPAVEGIPGQLRQVFQNLISNALKFAKENNKPEIRISGKKIENKSFNSKETRDGPYCMVSIRDNGIGFNNKLSAQIFTLFKRLHTRDKYEGTGIGLAISKKIIEKHNGIIIAESEEGKGTEFKIILPVRRHINSSNNSAGKSLA